MIGSCTDYTRNFRHDWTCILLMVQKSCTTWNVQNPRNNGMNYQPQLVSRISEPSTVPAMSVWERDEVAYMLDLNLHPATVAHNKKFFRNSLLNICENSWW